MKIRNQLGKTFEGAAAFAEAGLDMARLCEEYRRARSRAKRHEVFAKIYEHLKEPLLGYICSIVRDEYLAEDILQQTFIVLANMPVNSRFYRFVRQLGFAEGGKASGVSAGAWVSLRSTHPTNHPIHKVRRS